MDLDARNQYPIHMVKLVAPMIGVNYQIETGAASLSESNSDCDNKCNWSICGENLINVARGKGWILMRYCGKYSSQVYKSKIYDINTIEFSLS